MLLGVPLTMVSSATLAALTGADGSTAGGSVGQSLAHGMQVALGGTLAMGVAGFVLLFSLPLVFGATWWGMLSRGPSSGEDDDAPAFELRDSRESRFDAIARAPARGLSQMSFDPAEPGDRSDRSERGSFTPTVGQGHHNVGSLTQEPVPRRRGLAAQPRWKLTDEERARLDAMQPPPLAIRGAPRAEPSFGGSARIRPTGKGALAGRSGAALGATVGTAGAAAAASHAPGASRAVLPRGTYASGPNRGDALRMTEFVRAEPGLSSREPRMAMPNGTAGAAGAAGPHAMSSPMAPRATSVASSAATRTTTGATTGATTGTTADATSPVDPLHSTSIPGTTGYRRPVGMAPAHLRGTVVHSPFRKPQLGLEDVPPRGAPAVAPRTQVPIDPTITPATGGATPSNLQATASTPDAAGASTPVGAVARSAAGPVMRGAASWSATDAATPLASDVSDFSPIDWSVNDMDTPPVEAASQGPTPEMLAQAEAARVAEQTRIAAMAALRNEAEALLRDLRQWSRTDTVEGDDVTSAEPPPAPARSDVTAIAVAPVEGGAERGVRGGTVEAAGMAQREPSTDPMPPTASPAQPEALATDTSLAPEDVLNLPPTVLLPKSAVAAASAPVAPLAHASAAAPSRPFVFADVLASVVVDDAPRERSAPNYPTGPTAPGEPAFVSVARPQVIEATPAPAPSPPTAVTEAPFDMTDDRPPFEVADMSEVADVSASPETSGECATGEIDDGGGDLAPLSKPHYVLRADGTWARADGVPMTSEEVRARGHLAAQATAPSTSPAPSVPAIPSFGALSPADPPAANFSPDTPYELPPPRVAIDYDLPALDLLSPATSQDIADVVSDAALAAVSQLIEQRLAEFKVPVTVVGASAGPVITRFEVEPAVGVRGAQVVGLMKDLARALGVTSIRVVETIPGKTCMGLELPNAQRQMIRLSEILTAPAFDSHRSRLALAMGKDITGEPVVADLARAPHLLVAGTTGSGKSVAVNAMILSLLYKATPDDVRLIMIDPKMLELSVYGGIPHLLAPVVTDMKQAAHALNWCVGEMEKRYRLMSALGVRNLAGYNEKIDAARAAGEKVSNPFSLTPDAPEPLDRLPFIVVVIDELADLMMVAGKKIEELIARLAQKARAAGIHLILATQRPSVDVITGLIKANIPTRVAFQVSSKIDSRTILDQMGAESLLGQGDMLFLPPGTGYPQRVHGAFVADDEVHRVVQHWQQYGEPDYDEAILAGDPADAASADLFGDTGGDAEADPLYDEAAAFVLNSRRASISAVQRQLRIGYNRAARLIEQMEAAGLVTPMGRNGTREVVAPGD
ncbi:DNA translocase FtsK [Pandoraea vervacti]|nr:DNA translocase FtsK [Pandoraea vervacti]